MNFIFVFIYLLLGNGFFILISKKTFGKCIPITMMINAFAYFFSQVIFHTFKLGFIINILFAIIFILMVIFKKIANKDLTLLKKNYFSKGFYSFLVICIIIFIFDFNRGLSVWDSFSHWGVMVKEMLRLDNFYTVDASTLLVHKDYPPIVQLLEVFFCHLSGGYSETIIVKCVHLLGLSLFIPAICEFDLNFSKSKTIFKSIFLVFIVFLTTLFFDQHGIINTIYVDYLMAYVTAYLLGKIIFSKNPLDSFYLLSLSIACSFLVLIKQMALTLYMMVIFMFVLDFFLKYKNNLFEIKRSNIIRFVLKIFILLIIIPLMIWKGWGLYTDSFNLNAQFSISDLKVLELPKIMYRGGGEDYQRLAANKYIEAIKTAPLTTSKVLPLSYLQCLILVLFLLYLIWYFYKKYFYKKQIPLISLTLTIGFIGYAFVMLLLYVFSFGKIEGPLLASFNRYIPTYVLICMSLLVMMFVFVDSKEDKTSKSVHKMLVLFVILAMIQNPELIKSCLPKISQNYENIFSYHAKEIMKYTEENSKIFLVSQDSSSEYQYFVKYFMNPRTTNLKYYNLPVEKIKNYEKYFDEHVKNYMLKYDYLYIAKIDEKFIEKYKFVFPDDDIKETNLYKIKNVNGNVELEKVKEK